MQEKEIIATLEAEVSIKQKVAALQQPATYPHVVDNVETKETHMSWVFLVDGFVYKLKKPVQNHMIDFRTIKARYQNCREEIRLNKRLAKNIYIGIMPLVVNEKGKILAGGKGTLVDWLVKMERVSEKNLLDYVIIHHRKARSRIEETAKLLAVFYKYSPPVIMSPVEFRKKLAEEINFIDAQLHQPVFNLPTRVIEPIQQYLVNFLAVHPSMFEKRIQEGKIIEAHGDLRPEHICLPPQAAVIDSLEFNRGLRIMDIAEELSFLDLECEMMGDVETGSVFFDCYKKLSADHIPQRLIWFYKAKRAFTRCYLVARHIAEPGYRKQPKWMKKATDYLQFAEKYILLLEE